MTSIGELIGTIALDDKFSGPANDVGEALGFTGESFKAVTGFAGLAAAGITAAAGAVVALGMHGSTVADVKDSFGALSERAGETADVMLGSLRDGTQGTISDLELMKLANAALGSGLVSTSKDMETLSAGAKLLAGRTGGDTAKAFDTLTDAMAKGKTEALKQFGVFVDSKSALEKYAAGINKSVGDLTDQQRATALSRAAMEALKGELAQAGPAALSFGDNIDRGKVAVQNLVDDLALAVAQSPVVRAGMESVGSAISQAFGSKQTDLVGTLMEGVNGFAIGLTYAGQTAIVAGQVFVTAFYAAKTVVLGVITAITGLVTAQVAAIAGIAELGTHIPIIGEKVKGFAEGAKVLDEFMRGATVSMAEQTAEAARGVMGTSAAHQALDGMSGALINAREAMQEAAKAQAEVADGAPRATTGIADMGGAAALTAQQIQQMQDEARRALEEQREMSAQARDDYQMLQDELTLLSLTGVEARLEQLRMAEAEELAAVHAKREAYGATYADMAAMVVAKYEEMRLAALGMHSSVAAAAAAQGFGTREEMEISARVAQETYERMRASGLFTEAALLEAKKKAEEAKRRLELETAGLTMTSNEALRAGALQLYGVLSEKFKAVAIAGAIISTYQAVAKSMAAAPWPANLVLAAGALAAGMANVAKIRGAQAGFAEGTPGTSFVDFGRETVIAAHGEEAIINRAQGATLAEVIAGRNADVVAAMDSQSAAEVRMLREEMAAQRRDLPLMLRDAMRLAMA